MRKYSVGKTSEDELWQRQPARLYLGKLIQAIMKGRLIKAGKCDKPMMHADLGRCALGGVSAGVWVVSKGSQEFTHIRLSACGNCEVS